MSSSDMRQPIAHMSTARPYLVSPTSNSGALYHLCMSQASNLYWRVCRNLFRVRNLSEHVWLYLHVHV